MYEEYKRLVSEYQKLLQDPSKLEDAKNLKQKIDECFNQDRLNIASSYLKEFLMVNIEPHHTLENGETKMKTPQEITDECNNIREDIGRKVASQMLQRNLQPTLLSFVDVVQTELIKQASMDNPLEILDDDPPKNTKKENPTSYILIIFAFIALSFVGIMIFPFNNPIKPQKDNPKGNTEVKEEDNQNKEEEKDPSIPTSYYKVTVFDTYELTIPNTVSFSYNEKDQYFLLLDLSTKNRAKVTATELTSLELQTYITTIKVTPEEHMTGVEENQVHGEGTYTIITKTVDKATTLISYVSFADTIFKVESSHVTHDVNEMKNFLEHVSSVLNTTKKLGQP